MDPCAAAQVGRGLIWEKERAGSDCSTALGLRRRGEAALGVPDRSEHSASLRGSDRL
jgi:hypothetical protein